MRSRPAHLTAIASINAPLTPGLVVVLQETCPEEALDSEAAASPWLAAGFAGYSDQKAIVHQPPAGADAPGAALKRAETGLSQPDLSGGSEGENPAYSVRALGYWITAREGVEPS